MKHPFMGFQYEQLAREQFCRTVSGIPFISDVEIITAEAEQRFGDFLAIVHFEDEELPVRFLVEVKSNGERRFVNQFMQMVVPYEAENCHVFMAPYISEESAEAMRSKHYSYMDLSGNCYILTRRILLSVKGESNKFAAQREKKNYLLKSSGAASAIIRTMLHEPLRQWQVKTLAEESGKAIGTISNVKHFLCERDWIREYPQGFQMKNIKEFFSVWAKDYHKKTACSYEFYSFERISELEQAIVAWSASHDRGAVLGGFSAAARYAPTVRYKKVDVYVELQFLDEFVEDLELQAVTSGGNVVITVPHDETPCMFSETVNNAFVTSPVQTVLDLLGHAGRGEEAADAIIAKEYREDGND